jgi:hypothetical protein
VYQATVHHNENDNFMQWLRTNIIYLKQNDLKTTIPATVGILFFVHPRPPLFEIYHKQLKAMFVGKPIPDFKIRRLLVKSGEEKAQDSNGTRKSTRSEQTISRRERKKSIQICIVDIILLLRTWNHMSRSLL